ncbi:flagellar protein FlaG [Duganella sp. sic0402]|uniref:flagellar protein FlaG n=1 Tax=Duganella sp. sic0402 TaxID=2854786 RepID=UPI001C4393EF|nr:flagellar protein FlaG [Duganella sp. sic0402]MBV7534637.1 flagellar protein FlaG [Duganella sp. sic0402]
MDTSSIYGFAVLPATAATAAAASMPVSGKNAGADAAKAIVAANAPAQASAPSKTELKKSVDAINRFLENNSEVHFSIDDDSGRSVVKVIDTETKKVLRQFPSEQSLEIGKNLTTKGLLIDSEA